MKSPIIFYRPDFCPNCKKNSIELFDFFNSPMKYNLIADKYMTREPVSFLINKKAIYRMRCRSCGKIFQIRWEGEYPLPDYYPSHKDNREFISNFKKMK